MARSGLRLSVRCRRQRGYLLLELLLGLLLAVVLVTLVFKATGTAGLSFGCLQDELQLQEAVPVAPFQRSRTLGSMILVDTASHATAAAVLVH